MPRAPRVVFVTQLVDPNDPVLGFVTGQIRALAALADVSVIANEVRNLPDDLGVSVVSLGKERALGRTARGLRYMGLLIRTIRRQHPDVLFAHMCPVYLLLATPVTRLFGIRSLLWFLHSGDTPALRLAEHLADLVLTAFPDSYPRSAAKVEAIGHSIDIDALRMAPLQRAPGEALRLVAIGRTSAVKDPDLIVDAVRHAQARGAKVELRIVGPSTTDSELAERRKLERRLSSDGLDFVTMEPGVEPSAIPSLIQEAHALVNATDSGSADKVVFEAMAGGRPAVVTSAAFAPLITPVDAQLLVASNDIDLLSAAIFRLAEMPEDELRTRGEKLRSRVEAEHSLRHWATAVVEIAAEVRTCT